MKTCSSCFLFLWVLGASAFAAQFKDGVPATIPNTTVHDFKSKINGISYRLWITAPPKIDSAVSFPVMYVLDGNELAGTAAFVSTKLAFGGGTKEIKPAVVVIIGYPSEDLTEWGRRRFLDLTPFRYRPETGGADIFTERPTGGGEAFLRVIEEEVKPFVASRFRIDKAQQAIWGHSLGGLLVLHLMFHNPTAFSTYCVSSPSIWYNDREVLAGEADFSKRVRSGELPLRILVNSAGDEQAPNAKSRMIDNASELAARLAALNPTKISVTRTIFPGESHVSVVSASLVRSLRFALGLN